MIRECVCGEIWESDFSSYVYIFLVCVNFYKNVFVLSLGKTRIVVLTERN